VKIAILLNESLGEIRPRNPRVKIAILLNESLGEISFEYASNLGKKVPILLNESLDESGGGTGSALFYYCLKMTINMV